MLSVLLAAAAAFSTFVALGTLYRKARSGVKPWVACFLDALLYLPAALRLGPFSGSSEDVMAAFARAMEATGIRDASGGDFLRLYGTTLAVGNERLSAAVSPLLAPAR